MGVLILGSTGMLGQALVLEARARKLESHGVARNTSPWGVDVADPVSLARVVRSLAPTVVVNCVADVSLACCEQEPGQAYLTNSRPVSVLAELSRELSFYLVQISTDHYFQGAGSQAHDEKHPVKLVNEYARTKFAGEAFALLNPESCVVRTNIVGFRGRAGQPTFIEWVLGCFQQNTRITMFEDYFTSSIDVSSLARALFDLIPYRPKGILNLASRQVASKKDFILSLHRHLGSPQADLEVGSIKDLAGPERSDSCGLDVARAEALLGRPLPDLETVTRDLVEQYRARRPCAVQHGD